MMINAKEMFDKPRFIKVTNSTLNLIDNLGWGLSKALWSAYLKIMFSAKGVRLGDGASFYGFSKVKRTNGSEIIIGRNLTLRSARTSNLIGINKPCIISTFDPNAKISIGDNCGLSGTVIGAFKSVVLGKNVRCGANTIITDSDWHPDDPRTKPANPITIGDNVWLGINVTVLKGVTIGENSVIGAGSVVTNSIPANVIAAGNPCKVIRTL